MKYILTPSNPKIEKSVAYGFLTYICHFAPAKRSGVNVCTSASPGCIKGCLNTSGRGVYDNTQRARIERTKFYQENPVAFMAQLDKEIGAAVRRAARLGLKLAIRMNGTSDIPELGIEVARRYPEIHCYDYTAHVDTLFETLPANYHITFSRKETNEPACKVALNSGFNVSVLFAGELPSTFWGKPVIDGTTHDLRFIDPKGVIVGLKPKGRARKDTTGFVIR